jgi:hypothetical protein
MRLPFLSLFWVDIVWDLNCRPVSAEIPDGEQGLYDVSLLTTGVGRLYLPED